MADHSEEAAKKLKKLGDRLRLGLRRKTDSFPLVDFTVLEQHAKETGTPLKHLLEEYAAKKGFSPGALAKLQKKTD